MHTLRSTGKVLLRVKAFSSVSISLIEQGVFYLLYTY